MTSPQGDEQTATKRPAKKAPRFNMAQPTAPTNEATLQPPASAVAPQVPEQATMQGAAPPAPAPSAATPQPVGRRPAELPPQPGTTVAHAPAGGSPGRLASFLADSDTSSSSGGDGGGISIPLSALMAGETDPELDTSPLNVKVPKYIIDALALAGSLRVYGEKLKQAHVANALRDYLPDELLDQTYANRYRRQRPR